jgi:molybdopterin-guanine dinucleotide biosynthesis protein A
MSTPFAAVLLAGGRSTRMKQDKALLHWHGQDLWQAQLHKLQSIGASRVLLSCRREQPLFPGVGVEIMHDPEGIDEGPLGAITRCLEHVRMPLLVLAVDMPWMTTAFLREHLVPRQELPKGRFFRGAHGDETLAGLYVPAMLPYLQTALHAKRLALQPIIEKSIAASLATTQIVNDTQACFFGNANTPHDWK